MADLDEVVDFGAGVDAGFADRGAVDAGVSLDLHIVFDDCGTGLEDLVPGAVGLASEAEAVSSDDGSVLQDDVVAQAAVLADDGVGMGEEVVSGLGMRVEDNVGQDDGVVADRDVIANYGVGPNVGVIADAGAGGDCGGGVDAGGVVRRTIEELDGEGEGEVGVFDSEGCGRDLGEVGFDEDGCCFGSAGKGGVFGIGDKCEVAGFGGFDSGYAGYFGRRIPVERGVEVLG